MGFLRETGQAEGHAGAVGRRSTQEGGGGGTRRANRRRRLHDPTTPREGEPVEIVYAAEGTPLVSGPAGIMKAAPNPSAARLFYSWAMGMECQQLLRDGAWLRSAHAGVSRSE